MVKIRLQRIGRKNQPAYRIVIADERAPRDGRFIERIGHYTPTGKQIRELDVERYQYWISKGAQPSERVQKIAEAVTAPK